MILAADVGGTKVNLALFDPERAPGRPERQGWPEPPGRGREAREREEQEGRWVS